MGGVTEERLLQFVTCGPILQEVIQRVRPGAAGDAFRALLPVPAIGDPLPAQTYLRQPTSKGKAAGVV